MNTEDLEPTRVGLVPEGDTFWTVCGCQYLRGGVVETSAYKRKRKAQWYYTPIKQRCSTHRLSPIYLSQACGGMAYVDCFAKALKESFE